MTRPRRTAASEWAEVPAKVRASVIATVIADAEDCQHDAEEAHGADRAVEYRVLASASRLAARVLREAGKGTGRKAHATEGSKRRG